MSYLQTRLDGSLLLSLHVQPGARRNVFVGLHGEALKLCLSAPPVDGRANKAIIAFLAIFFNLPKSSIIIRSGLHSREKKLLLTGIAEQDVRSLLEKTGIR